MEYIKVSKAAEKWGISARRIRMLCAEGKIDGVIRKGNLYMIPSNAAKPMDGRKGRTSLLLDIEKKSRDIKKLQNDLKIWLRKVENHYGVKPIIYASYKFKTKYLNDSVFDSYPYWIAHYYVDSVKYQGEWKFWQHTDVGTLPGIDEKVDLNIFNGSSTDLKGLLLK